METLLSYVRSARPDLTNRQMALLMVVYLKPGPHTVRGLAGDLSVSKPVVTRALNTLGAFGFIRRQKDESDLRNVFVERTELGCDFLGEFADLIDTAYDEHDIGASAAIGEGGDEPRS
ncbi:MAG: MarR family winged helix-turn-helix transcriptional regulator [Pacificimonas sp.]|nr:MarR family winged helix-turn-helix transcriptional regulator [Pacificimonas sp.]